MKKKKLKKLLKSTEKALALTHELLYNKENCDLCLISEYLNINLDLNIHKTNENVVLFMQVDKYNYTYKSVYFHSNDKKYIVNNISGIEISSIIDVEHIFEIGGIYSLNIDYLSTNINNDSEFIMYIQLNDKCYLAEVDSFNLDVQNVLFKITNILN